MDQNMHNNPSNRQRLIVVGLICLSCNGLALAEAAGDVTIAGLAPYERPANAPRLATDQPVDRQQALHGVSTPAPQSIEKFLQHQGGWFNPFLHPGMTGPYDLRAWHAQREAHK